MNILKSVWAARPVITAFLIIVVVLCTAACFVGFWSMSGNSLTDRCASTNDIVIGMGKWSWLPFGAVCSYYDTSGVTPLVVDFYDRGTVFLVMGLVALALLLLLNIKSVVHGLIHLADDVTPPTAEGHS